MLSIYTLCFLAFALLGLIGATLVTSDTRVAANQTFDYVIVGAGLSGITVANLLSGQGYSTLIIEAGTITSL